MFKKMLLVVVLCLGFSAIASAKPAHFGYNPYINRYPVQRNIIVYPRVYYPYFPQYYHPYYNYRYYQHPLRYYPFYTNPYPNW